MMAAITAAQMGHEVRLLEKNEKLGKKLYITGKGRCNITNDSDVMAIIEQIVSNPKFLFSSLYTFDAGRTIDFFESSGVPTKVERGNRVFPVSDKSSDVIAALSRGMAEAGVEVQLGAEVIKLGWDTQGIRSVYLKSGEMKADRVIVATGGFSYQITGSTGDGYKFASQVGHKIKPQEPALVPFNVKEAYVTSMQGLSLKNVALKFHHKQKVVYEAFGEMMFTHFGITGPIVLSASSYIHSKSLPMKVTIDLKPKLSFEKLDQRFLREIEKYNRKDLINSLDDLLPKMMIPVLLELAGVDIRKKMDQLTKEERHVLVGLMKDFPMTVLSKRAFREAIITQGGVDVKQINPNTMESKLCKGLYFVGEVLDVDALTGGYNLQVAFSTAYLAGINMDGNTDA